MIQVKQSAKLLRRLFRDSRPTSTFQAKTNSIDSHNNQEEATKLEEDILTDTFGRRHSYLRISLTERCNLRCIPFPLGQLPFRRMSTASQLTHVDPTGKASMVDVGNKGSSSRIAKARAVIFVGEQARNLIKDNAMKKGDVLTIAQIAGITAAKKTSDLIPLCHTLLLNVVKVVAQLDEGSSCVVISTEVRCEGRTGVEMEALCAASVAALTVYDMCKAVTHDMVIKEVRLVAKTGGVRGDYKLAE